MHQQRILVTGFYTNQYLSADNIVGYSWHHQYDSIVAQLTCVSHQDHGKIVGRTMRTANLQFVGLLLRARRTLGSV
jgi:hypothetical protein